MFIFKEEESNGKDELCDCIMTVGYLPSLCQISAIKQSGLIDVETLQLVSSSCMKLP